MDIYLADVEVTFISRCPAGEGGSGAYVASGYSVYEEENERLQEGLKAKVNVLKSVSNLLWRKYIQLHF